MNARLERIRRILSMDANEATERVVSPYLGLFRRYPVPMHLLGSAIVIGVLAGAWFIFGGRAALIAFALIAFWPVVLTTAALLRRSKHRGTS
jgi:ABC-type nitrate/sulfonate/bicarbonate transport system permease component